MNIKRKLFLGLVTAVLGLCLIGGGTLSYFSDAATIHNGMKAGTIDLFVDTNEWDMPLNFDLDNIRPGDRFERQYVLKNVGSLAIEDVLLDVAATVKDTLGTGATADQFLDALVVNYWVDMGGGPTTLLKDGDITLNQAINGNFVGNIKDEYLKDGKFINLTPRGIDSGKSVKFRIMIHFKDSGYPRNHLQGMKAKIDFNLNAKQIIGNRTYGPGQKNGYLTGNGKVDGFDDGKTEVDVSKHVADQPAVYDVKPWKE